MNLYKNKLVGIILLLFIAGCREKDDLTLPVRVNLKIGIDVDGIADYEYLSFTKCQIGINSIQFEGTRESGSDVYFNTGPDMDLQTLTFLRPIIISSFDIPQGIYNYMKWDISVKCIDTEGLIKDRDESYPCIGIIIQGNYEASDGTIVPFILAIDKPDKFSIIASNADNNSTIVISVNKEYEAIVILNAVDAFRSISRESLEKAISLDDSGHPEIVISSSENENLYSVLTNSIFQSAKLIVK